MNDGNFKCKNLCRNSYKTSSLTHHNTIHVTQDTTPFYLCLQIFFFCFNARQLKSEKNHREKKTQYLHVIVTMHVAASHQLCVHILCYVHLCLVLYDAVEVVLVFLFKMMFNIELGLP